LTVDDHECSVSSMGGEKMVACMLSLTLMRSVYGQHMPEEPCSVQILVPGLKGTTYKLHHIMPSTRMTQFNQM